MKRTSFPPSVWMLCIIFKKWNLFLFHWKICFSQCHNNICIHNEKSCACYTSSISNLFRNIGQRKLFKMIPNMNGIVNRLLRFSTVLSTFQMPLVFFILELILSTLLSDFELLFFGLDISCSIWWVYFKDVYDPIKYLNIHIKAL